MTMVLAFALFNAHQWLAKLREGEVAGRRPVGWQGGLGAAVPPMRKGGEGSEGFNPPSFINAPFS